MSPQNERKMNLQSQIQIYLLSKKGGEVTEKWAKEAKGESREKNGM